MYIGCNVLWLISFVHQYKDKDKYKVMKRPNMCYIFEKPKVQGWWYLEHVWSCLVVSVGVWAMSVGVWAMSGGVWCMSGGVWWCLMHFWWCLMHVWWCLVVSDACLVVSGGVNV